jgi:serine protease AprX
MNLVFVNHTRRKAVWGPRRTFAMALAILFSIASPAFADKHPHYGKKAKPGLPNHFARHYRMDDEVERRSRELHGLGKTQVIVTLEPGADVPHGFQQFSKHRRLDLIDGEVLEVPNGLLRRLSEAPHVLQVHYDRPTRSHNYRTAVTVGARAVFAKYGYTGAGVGVAVIDSGITSWHDDLVNFTNKSFPYGNQRVAKFVDFVNGQTLPYDDNGHGTHVSGIIAGGGFDSAYEKAGIAPNASLISLKVLDQNGSGRISNLIAALDWTANNYQTYNIRVVNMSVGAGVYESYWTDPLTIAARKVVEKGITVVAAAGNMGKNDNGELQWGGITAPGNAPWVVTVGASTTNGTTVRSDDEMASFSSSGPTAFDFAAKPDLVAPGVGTISLAAAGSQFFATKSQYLVPGTNGQNVYLALSGTSMAAPVVSGTIALMLQANPNLTPNLIKAILEYTAESHANQYSALREGAGFLNTAGAVDLARFYAIRKPGSKLSVVGANWSRTILWGNHLLSNGDIVPTANAWALNVVWGTATTLADRGDNVVWGTQALDGDNVVWGTLSVIDNVVWGTTRDGDNVVWGTTSGDNVVWGTAGGGDNVVWGTSRDGDNVVWGTDCGGADCFDKVWGAARDGDNVVWGTARDGDNVVWGTAKEGDNVVWGTTGLDNIVWSTSTDGESTWGSSGLDDTMYPDETDPLPSTVFDFSIPVTVSSSSIDGGL